MIDVNRRRESLGAENIAGTGCVQIICSINPCVKGVNVDVEIESKWALSLEATSV